MCDVGSKTLGSYDEFRDVFASFEKVISYDLKTAVLGDRLRAHNGAGGCWPRKLAFEVQATGCVQVCHRVCINSKLLV